MNHTEAIEFTGISNKYRVDGWIWMDVLHP